MEKTLRLKINAQLFNQAPVRTIKQLIGQNSTLLSYKLNSMVTWNGEVIVDVIYRSISIDQFTIYYIPMDSIKHLMPNSEKYITTINGCNVKLNNPKLNQFNNYLPVRIKTTIINGADDYEQYYTESIEQESLHELNNNGSELASYFGTTVSNPLNSLMTPISSLVDGVGNIGFSLTIPEQLYPKTFKAKETYNINETLRYYKQSAQATPALQLVDNIKVYEQKQLPDVDSSNGTTAYIINAELLPDDHSINGIVMIQPKRIPDMIFYYPTNSFTISVDELKSIKTFIKADEINYCNFMYLKK